MSEQPVFILSFLLFLLISSSDEVHNYCASKWTKCVPTRECSGQSQYTHLLFAIIENEIRRKTQIEENIWKSNQQVDVVWIVQQDLLMNGFISQKKKMRLKKKTVK